MAEEVTPGTGGAGFSGNQPVVEKSATDSLSAASVDSPPAGPSRPIGRRGETLEGLADLTLRAAGTLRTKEDVARAKEDVARPVEAMLRDPLTDVARKERRSLLGISMVAVLVGKTGLVPEKIENLGITFTAPERAALLWVLLAIVVYYTFAFVSYATSDLLTYRHAVHLGRQEIRRQRLADANVKDNLTKPGDPEASSPWRLTRWVTPASVFRAIFDFVVPVLVAIYALGVLWGATHTAIQPKPVPPPATAPALHK